MLAERVANQKDTAAGASGKRGPGAGRDNRRRAEHRARRALVQLRDPHAGFISYAPRGSIAKGKALVTGGGGGKTVACGFCHGPDLKPCLYLL